MRTGRLGWKPRWDRGPVEAGSYTGLLPLGPSRGGGQLSRVVNPQKQPREDVSALHSRGLWTSAVSDWPAPSTPRLAGDLPAPAPSPIRPSDNRSPAARLQGHLTGIPEHSDPGRPFPNRWESVAPDGHVVALHRVFLPRVTQKQKRVLGAWGPSRGHRQCLQSLPPCGRAVTMSVLRESALTGSFPSDT